MMYWDYLHRIINADLKFFRPKSKKTIKYVDFWAATSRSR